MFVHAEAFGECRIPQAVNHCVFEVAFVDSVEAVIEDKSSEIIVYGQSDRFYAAAVAAKRLSQAGYSDVKLLEGGLEGWKESGHETYSKPESDRVQWRHFDLDTKLSRLRWIGRSLMTQHEGELSLSSGSLEFDHEGSAKSGEALVDMASLRCSDLDEPSLASSLVSHLASVDFFDTAKHPVSSFAIDRFYLDPDARVGQLNVSVEGVIRIRGIEQQLALDAQLAAWENGYVLQCQFDLDRTHFGAIYGSGRFFAKLGKHLVNDLVSVQVNAVFKPRV